MRKKRRDPLEAGTIIKQVAPVLGLSVEKLAGLFADHKQSWGDDLPRHYLMGETPWPFEDMDYDECFDLVSNFLDEQQQKGALTEREANAKKEEVRQILSVAFMDLKHCDMHRKESTITGINRIEDEIAWIMRDISNLDTETLYILNRFFCVFSSITECDLQWIDFLDCLGNSDKCCTLDKFRRKISKEEFPISCELILENMNRKDFQQWLELLSRKNYRDATRKTDSNKLISSIEKKVRTYINDCGFEGLPFHNFIQYLVNNHHGSFFDIDRKYWKIFLLIKYWLSHFEKVPEISIDI